MALLRTDLLAASHTQLPSQLVETQSWRSIIAAAKGNCMHASNIGKTIWPNFRMAD